MYNEIGGKCITLCISADHRRFRSKLRVLNNWRWSGGWHQGLAAVPVGGGGAWPGFEATRRAEGSQRGRLAGGPPPTGTPSSPAHSDQAYRADHAQRTACGRAAAHGHTKQPGSQRAARPTQRPGPPAPGTPASPQPMFHVKHLPIHRPRYPVSPGKWHT